jgi:hypothetical protein
MNGFGRGGGWARGTVGYGWRRQQLAGAPAGYRYVGACRCGFGPNAYYQDQSGRVVPAASLFSSASGAPAPSEDVEQLKAEKAELERRLRALEERLRGSE